MNKEEKEVIKAIEHFKNYPTNWDLVYEINKKAIKIVLNLISKLEKENEQLRDIKNKAIGHINACKTNLGNYALSPSEIECLLEILKEEEND